MSAALTAQPIVDQLGTLTGELALMIIANKEKNNPPPDRLMLGVKGIGIAANTLHQVADKLAEDEYDDFPVIQEEIYDASRDVQNGSELLRESVDELAKKQERGAAWDRVGFAVSQMATKTSLLLHIVYGAEIKKIVSLAQQASAGVHQLADDARQLQPGEDPASFVARVQDEAKKLKNLADQLATKAGQEDNPETKKQLKDLADDLIGISNEMIGATNQYLQNQDDPAAKKALLDAIGKLGKHADVLNPEGPAPALEQLIPRVRDGVQRVVDEDKGRPIRPGKGKPQEGVPPGKNYNFVPPHQFAPADPEEPYPWPQLRSTPDTDRAPPADKQPDWVNKQLTPSRSAQPAPGTSAPSSSSPNRAGDPAGSPSQGQPGKYQRQPKGGDDPSKGGRGWMPGKAGPNDNNAAPGKNYNFVPPEQLPFPADDPPYPWPRLRKTDGPQSSEPKEPDFPWRDLRNFMPQAKAVTDASAVHDSLNKVRDLLDQPKPKGKDVAAPLKQLSKQLDDVAESAPLLGKTSGDKVKKDVDELKKILKKELIPSAMAQLNDKSPDDAKRQAPKDAAEKMDDVLRRILQEANQPPEDHAAVQGLLEPTDNAKGRYQRGPKKGGDTDASQRGWKPGKGSMPRNGVPNGKHYNFVPPEQLPPPEGEKPFPWPKLRKWVPESVATAADELLDTLKDVERVIRHEDKPSAIDVPADHLKDGINTLRYALAPRLGASTADKLIALCDTFDQTLDKSLVPKAKKALSDPTADKKPALDDVEKLRDVAREILEEANLSKEDLQKLRKRNKAKADKAGPAYPNKGSNARDALKDTLGDVNDALGKAIGGPKEPNEEVADAAIRLKLDVEAVERKLDRAATEGKDLEPVLDDARDQLKRLEKAAKKLPDAVARDVICEVVKDVHSELLDRFVPTAKKAVKDPSKNSDVKQSGAKLKDLLDQVVSNSNVTPEKLNKLKTMARAEDLIGQLLEASNGGDVAHEDLLSASKKLTDLLGELCALLKLEGADQDVSDLMNRLMKQLDSTNPYQRANARSQDPHTAPPKFTKVAVGYDTIAAGAQAIEEMTLHLPKPVKGSLMLSEGSSLVQHVKKVSEAIAKLGRAAKAGNGAELVATSRELQKLTKPLEKHIRKVRGQAKDKDTRDKLASIEKALGNHPVQIKILSGVRATLEKQDFDKNDQLYNMVLALQGAVYQVVPAVNTVILTT